MVRSMRVGALEVVSLSDNTFGPPPSGFMPNIPAEAWEPYRAQHLDANGNLTLNLGSFLIHTGGPLVLVDTGIGPQGGMTGPGHLMDELAAVHTKPEDIDIVLITHMHFDHIGWNTVERDGKRVTTFPKARYAIQSAEWAYWTAEEGSKEIMERLAYPVQQAGQLDLVGPDYRPVPEITMIPTPGHTPGHVSPLLSSKGEHAVVLGDVAHTPVQVSEPDWSISADVHGDQARATRGALWDRIDAEGLRLAAGHFPSPGFGRIARLDGKRTWRAL